MHCGAVPFCNSLDCYRKHICSLGEWSAFFNASPVHLWEAGRYAGCFVEYYICNDDWNKFRGPVGRLPIHGGEGRMSELKGNVNTIFFDAGGVLFDTEMPRAERIRHILRAKGFDDSAIEKGLRKGEEFSDKYLNDGNWLWNWSDEEKYWDKYYEVISNEISQDASYSLKQQLFHHTHYAIHCKLFDEVRSLLESLNGTYRLGVISNAFPSMDWVFDRLDIRKYFDSITISAFVGECKPDKNIYEIALNSMNVKAEECIFIDDKMRNVEAAEKLGFRGVHLDRETNDLRILKPMLDANLQQNQKCV